MASPFFGTAPLRFHRLLVSLSSFLIICPLILNGCSGFRGYKPSYPPGYPLGFVERGAASWYGPGFHGNKTASGEQYDMNQLTAAHRTLPLGSVVVVRSLTSGREVQVRINDRGPFARGRILDLSYAGARALSMIGPGTDDVEIRVVDYLDGSYQGPLRVQVGSFADIAHARALLSQLEMSHYNARIVQADAPGGRRYRVQVGYYQSEAQAEAIASRLGIQLGLDPFLVRDESP